MMKASSEMSSQLKTKAKHAKGRIDYKNQQQGAIDHHQQRLQARGHDSFMFKPVTAAWSTVTEKENAPPKKSSRY